jgi:hypothetical protein
LYTSEKYGKKDESKNGPRAWCPEVKELLWIVQTVSSQPLQNKKNQKNGAAT